MENNDLETSRKILEMCDTMLANIEEQRKHYERARLATLAGMKVVAGPAMRFFNEQASEVFRVIIVECDRALSESDLFDIALAGGIEMDNMLKGDKGKKQAQKNLQGALRQSLTPGDSGRAEKLVKIGELIGIPEWARNDPRFSVSKIRKVR